MLPKDKIYIAGHTGLVGSALLRNLEKNGYTHLVYRTHQELDLTQQHAVNDFFKLEKPDYVFLAAAKVGGIQANNNLRAEFIYQNLAIQMNVIHAAYQHGVKRLLFLGSSCMYPRECPQPMKEEYLLSGYLEPTNEPYAIAKIAGLKMCEAYNRQYGTDFRYVIPTNVYGPNDCFDLQNSHVIPALIRKIHEAKLRGDEHIMLWGTGEALREFMYIDDMVEACVFVMMQDGFDSAVNIGSGVEVSMKQLAELICDVVGFQGEVVCDTSKADGMMRKLLDDRRLKELGWEAKTSLKQGLEKSYEWFLGSFSNSSSAELSTDPIIRISIL